MTKIYLEDLIIFSNAKLRDALEKISANVQGIVFICDQNKKLLGTLSDGDVRRALMRNLTLEAPVVECMHTKFKALPFTASREQVLALLNNGVRHIPLLDPQGTVVDFASVSRMHQLSIMEPYLNGNELAYVTECINTKWISSQGKFVLQFEEQFSKMHDGMHAVSTSNGTTALHLALISLGVGPGDEVIVPDLTFAATINAVLHAGATPVIVDVEHSTWGMDPKSFKAAITGKTKAVIIVHLYGQPASMDALMKVAADHGLLVVEDVAEALGATSSGKLMGTYGDASCFSFFGNKMLTTGEGGMVLYKSATSAARGKMLRDHGMSRDKKYWHLEVGYNYRMTNLQAAIGVAQMEQFDEILHKKLKLADDYFESLKDIDWVQLPPRLNGDQSVYWLFTVLVAESAPISRDELMRSFALNGIDTRPVFYPLSDMPLYKAYARNVKMPVTQDVAQRGISLPSSVEVSSADIARIKDVLSSLSDLKVIRSHIATKTETVTL